MEEETVGNGALGRYLAGFALVVLVLSGCAAVIAIAWRVVVWGFGL